MITVPGFMIRKLLTYLGDPKAELGSRWSPYSYICDDLYNKFIPDGMKDGKLGTNELKGTQAAASNSK
jgi:hypothetical protein